METWNVPEDQDQLSVRTPEGLVTLEADSGYVYISLTKAHYCPRLVSKQARGFDLVTRLNKDISDYYIPIHKYIRIR